MSELLEFLRTHDEAFRSRARLASLYSDFRNQRSTNPDGYNANAAAWLRGLTSAANDGLIPSQSTTGHDHFVLRTGEELVRSLQTQEYGRPLALGAVIEDAARRKEIIQLRVFLDAKKSVYARSWVPTPWQVLSWGLRVLGVTSGDGAEDKLVKGDFVIMANVEAASKAVLDQAAKTTSISVTSRIFSKEQFVSAFSAALGVDTISPTDLSVLLTHLSRDKEAIAYDPSTKIVKLRSPQEAHPEPVTEEDISIANLSSLIVSLQQQVDTLTSRITTLDSSAREAVAKKQLTSAKSALRSKKLAETQLAQRTGTLTQLEEIYAKIEQAADQVEILRVMEASSKTLATLNKQTGGVERVQDVVDGLRDQMMNADEIGQAINEVSAGTVDESEVDDELEALEKIEREKAEAEENKRKEKEAEVEAEATRKRLEELDQMGEKQKADDAVKHVTAEPGQDESKAEPMEVSAS